MRRCCVIVNPAAGKGAAAARVATIAALLRERGLDAALSLTTRPGHAAELARAAALAGCDAIAVAGGDGTANEVINGLVAAQAACPSVPPLAVLPAGRGNDLAFSLGVVSGLEAAVAALAAGRTRPFDVGRVCGGDYPEGRCFGNGVGVGFDTLVGLAAARMRRVTGATAYALAAARLIAAQPEAPLVRLRFAGREVVRRVAMVSLMNGRRLGGAFHAAPGAAFDDGLIDVCAAAGVGRARMVALFLRYLRGTQARSRHVATGRGERVSVEALAGTLAVHADGETICTAGRAIEVECLPRRLTVLATA